eukprot:CAMPEP_0117440526 /NCGR_PEP_ID=MMETSP0759-20121206/3143_1 /TAXON_ID=63605 /ORGANISM="Percolomonas cosmopolitus, Strain WS" /LENGTH=516 /DNA_ID=CAMNT_0005232309 /DNA_START=47 /DNA_END=1597 /DNA_ORIENTATION=+
MSTPNEILLSTLSPANVFQYFAQLSNIPRQSMKEEPVREWLRRLCKEGQGKQYGWEYSQDHVGNVLIRVPANRDSLTNAHTLVFQGHLDMVCEKDENHTHDFAKHPIQLELSRDSKWLHAKGTTLGADNGIGVCIALGVASDESLPHGPLELLFTIDEEESMLGAESLKDTAKQNPQFINGRYLINLDSEEDGVFCIGCAGALETMGQLPVERNTAFQLSSAHTMYKLKVSGLLGGHSGVDINKGLANANKILARALIQLHENQVPIELLTITGGRKRNAIARDASALIYLTQEHHKTATRILEEIVQKSEFESVDKDLRISLETPSDKDLNSLSESNRAPLTSQCAAQLIRLLAAVPHGVARMSPDIENFVETSTNFGVVTTEENYIELSTMQRSSHWEALQDLNKMVKMVFELAGCEVIVENPLTPWQPQPQSELLNISKRAFKELRGEEPHVEAIHAGLECGLIVDAYPDMSCVSYGPTILGAHSPSERCNVADVGSCYDLTVQIMKTLYEQQ